MTEWFPEGYYTGSAVTTTATAATADPPTQTILHCQSWEESWDQGKTGWNMKTGRDLQKCVHGGVPSEDIGIPPTSKKKKNGGADPRFRRVINPDYRSETDMETGKLGQEERATDEKVVSFLKIPNDSSFFTSPSLRKISDANGNVEVTKDTGFRTPQNKYYRDRGMTYENVQDVKSYRELEKSSSLTNLKRSASDCTLNKKKAFGEDDEDGSDKVRAYPSATRLARVHNWMKDYNIFPEKRRSVITVIGQTQTKPFSKILSEINQRRKLAKELDRHALCEAIMESAENQRDVKNLVAKVDLVLPDGKVIYSTEKVYLRRDNKFTDAGAYTHQSMEALDSGDVKKTFQMIPERDLSVSQFGRKSRTKRSGKKLASPPKEKLIVKGKMKTVCGGFSSVLIWSVLAMICLSVCFSLFFYSVKPSQTYFLVEFFKPKTTAWYEKLLF